MQSIPWGFVSIIFLILITMTPFLMTRSETRLSKKTRNRAHS